MGLYPFRYYLAILRGHMSQNLITVDQGIGEDVREAFRGVRMASASFKFCTNKWRNATTHIAVLERGYCYNYPATKVLMRPITGRRHQLRVHCNHIGHTIVGDYTYSNRQDVKPYRMFLHAYKLVLDNEVEPLNILTKDPFTTADPRNEWMPYEFVKSECDAINVLESLSESKEGSNV